MATADTGRVCAYARLRRERLERELRARGTVGSRGVRRLLESYELALAHLLAREAGIPVPQGAEAWRRRLAEIERALATGPPWPSPPRPGLASVEVVAALHAWRHGSAATG